LVISLEAMGVKLLIKEIDLKNSSAKALLLSGISILCFNIHFLSESIILQFSLKKIFFESPTHSIIYLFKNKTENNYKHL
jgi:hypothetical protein